MLTALSVTDDPSGTPRTGRFSVVFAETCLTNVSVPFWMTYTFTAVAQLFVKWIVDSAVVGDVRTDAARGPQALIIVVATATPSATQNLFIGISSHAARVAAPVYVEQPSVQEGCTAHGGQANAYWPPLANRSGVRSSVFGVLDATLIF